MYSEYIQNKKKFQEILLSYIDCENNTEEHFQQLTDYFDDKKIREYPTELKILFTLLTKISNFHNRCHDFFEKIEKIILLFKKELSENLSKSEIFDIFKSNKRLLLFLFEEKILILDLSICTQLSSDNNDDTYYYFYPEIKSLFPNFERKPTKNGLNNTLNNILYFRAYGETEESSHKKIVDLIEKDFNEFQRKRKIGENDSEICKLIREDDIDHFISYVNKNNQSLTSNVSKSVFETNSYLIKHHNEISHRIPTTTSLIEYAAFFGSIQIFKYLFLNQVKLNESIWKFAIHGCHQEIIQIIEENVKPSNNSKYQFQQINFDSSFYKNCFNFAIKCFQNECAYYIQINHLYEIDLSKSSYSSKTIKYFNFQFFQEDLQNDEVFANLCKYGYFTLVNYLIQTNSVNITQIFENKPLIFAAIENNHFEIMKLLFEQRSFDINERFLYKKNNKKTQFYGLLHAAIRIENIEMVEFLLEQNNIDVNINYIKLNDGGNISIKYINELDTRIETEDIKSLHGDIANYISRKTALHLAVKKGNIKIVSLLLNNSNINVNIKTLEKKCRSSGYNNRYIIDDRSTKMRIIRPSVIIALENDYFEIAELLLNHPNIDINCNSCYNYEYSFDYRDYSHRKDYTENQAYDSASEYKTVLYAAIEKENIKIVQLLLNNPKININAPSTIISNQKKLDDYISNLFTMDPDDADCSAVKPKEVKLTPLKIAVFKENHDILKILLEHPNLDISCGAEAVEFALKNGWVDIYNILLSHPEFNDKNIFTGALHKGINSGNVEMVKILLNRSDVDINEVVDGKTILEVAAKIGNIEIFNLLLKRPDFDIMKENCGTKALKTAALEGNIDIFKILLDEPGIDINDNSDASTALKNAVYSGNLDIVKLLLHQNEIDVNDETNGKTALKVAAELKNIEMVKLLVSHPDIEFDPETIYDDFDLQKYKIVNFLFETKAKRENFI